MTPPAQAVALRATSHQPAPAEWPDAVNAHTTAKTRAGSGTNQAWPPAWAHSSHVAASSTSRTAPVPHSKPAGARHGGDREHHPADGGHDRDRQRQSTHSGHPRNGNQVSKIRFARPMCLGRPERIIRHLGKDPICLLDIGPNVGRHQGSRP